MSKHRTNIPTLLACSLALAAMSCGGSGDSTTPSTLPTPTPTPAPQATPTPTPTPTATPTPDASAKCNNLAAGPVFRLAIAPREVQTNGSAADMLVRARKNFDEVLCIDKDKEHRIDFNLNQRNEDGQECCWDEDPSWRVEDPENLVTGENSRHDFDFIWRLRIDPQGKTGRVAIQATLDGVESHPWQSGSGYSVEPLYVVSMSAGDIRDDCQCIYIGGGQYEGENCPK